jgi:metal-dependent amidase/aminoacylase/carboxypeptidase family protein
VFEARTPVAIFAYHTAPMNVGQLVTAPTLLMAPRHSLDVRIAGSGDRAAAANVVRAEIAAISTMSFAESVQSAPDTTFIVAQPYEPIVEGDAIRVEASITTASDDAEGRARAAVEHRLKALAFPNITITHRYESRFIAGVSNTPALVARASAVAESILGPRSVQPLPGVVPAFSEDFGSFQQKVPGAMFFLGVSNPEKGWVGMPHTPGYVADETAIGLGAKVMAAILLDVLSSDDGV